MNRSDAADRLERLLRRDLDDAAREAGPPGADEIDAYVAGRASAAEREVIDSWLADDPALREEVDALMAMRQAIEADVAGGTAKPMTRDVPAAAAAATPTPPSKSTLAPTPQSTPLSTPQSTPARKPKAPRPQAQTQKRSAAPGSLHQTTREMRARPRRTAALLAIAASLAFFILWVASPGRPPVEPERAAGGATPPTTASPTTAPAPAPASPDATSPTATLTLRDGGGEVSLLANGEIRGLEGLDASNRSAIARALASGRLETTSQIDALASSASQLRAPGDAATPPALRVVKPLATAVRTARPTFEWTAIPGASSYRVRIADASLDPVAESPVLKTTNWTPETPLPAGRVLTWQVEAQTPRGPIVAPAPPAPEARILVLRSQDVDALSRELTAAKNSDLAAVVALARFGVLDEADAALARLATANSNAAAITQLRQQLSNRRFPR
jgi:hypothetical protein